MAQRAAPGMPGGHGTPDRPSAATAASQELAGLARALNENLAAWQALLRQLLDLAGEKLAAMRSADGEALARCSGREAEVLAQVFRADEQRHALVARAAQAVPAAAGRPPRLPELVLHFPPPLKAALQARHAGLRQMAEQLQTRNRLVARVACNLQTHLRAVFTELARANQEAVVYGPKGQHEARPVRLLVDAVG